MAAGLHGSACTTPRVRAELQAAKEGTHSLAARYGLNPKTVAKWRKRASTADAPMGAANFAKHLKALRWRTPFQAICDAWAKDPAIFKINPHHLIPGPNILTSMADGSRLVTPDSHQFGTKMPVGGHPPQQLDLRAARG